MTVGARFGVLLLVVGAGSARVARGQAPTDTLPADATSAVIAAGKKIFLGEGLCLACHGPDAKGLVGPNLTDQAWLQGTGTFPEILARVLAGVTSEQSKQGQIMPPRGGSGISDEQVRAVAAYVWSLNHKPSRT